MTYFPTIGIYGADTPSADAFGRLRQSSPYTLFDSKLSNSSGGLVWDISGSNGGFTEYSQSAACVYLKTPAVANSSVVRQTKSWFNYQPGKSQLIVLTGILEPEAGVIKRLGYFNESNGLFFESSGSEMYVVKRSNVSGTAVDTKVSQSNWNLDPMNGTGPSGITKDYTKAQIFFMDFEWLGVGRVRYGHYHGGGAHYVHQFAHENDITDVYMQNPNLPVRFEITNIAGSAAHEFKTICTSVMSEGGLQPQGVTRTIDTNGTAHNITQNTTGSLVAIRLKDGQSGVNVNIVSAEIFTSTANLNGYWQISYNPSGSNSYTWADIPNSSLQYATNASGSVINTSYAFPNSVKISSGYISNTTQAKQSISVNVSSLLRLGSFINGTKDVIVLGFCPLNDNAAVYGALTVEEIS